MLFDLWQMFLAAAGYEEGAQSPLLGYPSQRNYGDYMQLKQKFDL